MTSLRLFLAVPRYRKRRNGNHRLDRTTTCRHQAATESQKNDTSRRPDPPHVLSLRPQYHRQSTGDPASARAPLPDADSQLLVVAPPFATLHQLAAGSIRELSCSG